LVDFAKGAGGVRQKLKMVRRTRAAVAAVAAENNVPEEVPHATEVMEVTSQTQNSVNNAESQPAHTNSNSVETDHGHVNGKVKSAAQKKREKRKQRKREGSVVSEISDAESVHLLLFVVDLS
jgi:hypothetical protein